MANPWAPLVHISASLLLLSCGARTGMLDLEGGSGLDAGTDSAAGSSGHAGTGGFAGSGGSAGKGGAAGTGGTAGANTCPSFTQKGETVEFKGNSWLHATRPLFAPASDDGNLIALAAEGLPVESPGPTAARLQLVAFHAWDAAWPPYDFSTAQEASTSTGVNYTKFARGFSDQLLAMAWPATPSPPDDASHGVFFVPDLSPYSGNWTTNAVSALAETALSDRAAFVVRANGEHVVGYFQLTDAGGRLRASRMPSGTTPKDLTLLACGKGDLSAAAQWNGTSMLLAASSSRTPLGCADNNGMGDLPSHVTLVSRSIDGATTKVLYDIAQPDDAVAFVNVELHDSGSWLVYQYMGLTAELQPPPQVVRLSANGGVMAGPVQLNDATGEVAIARMGNKLAVAWLASPEPGAHIELRLLNEDASIGASYSLESAPGMPHGYLSLIGSPDADKLLVAWSVAPMGGGMLDITWVARLECAGPG